MAQQHDINGTNVNHVTAVWSDRPVNSFLNGKTTANRWRSHRWTSNVMTESEFNTLEALEGQTVSITTTKYSDRNNTNYVTYYDVKFLSITGTHSGPRFEGVSMEFAVLV